MKDVIDIFKELTKVPRCSGTTSPFIEYLRNFSFEYNFNIYIDNSNNILCKKENSKAKLCLQSHYDIVCLTKDTVPSIIEKDGYLLAEDSTLGADNGIGCAYMLSLMSENYDCEYLFTSDEEIGLIGANNIDLEINSSYMLNLDSEDEGIICIGCAGGVDFFAKNYNKQIIKNIDNLDLYEISISNLQGGHSGININDDIPNALKLISICIKESNAKILDLNAGEKINSIPVNAKAIVASNTRPLQSHENMKIIKLDTKSEHLNIYNDSIIDFIYAFSNGVRGYNNELSVVQTSINLAISSTSQDCIELQLSARAMQNDLLNAITLETTSMLEFYGFRVKTSGKYPAWKPDINTFTNKVLEIYKKYDKNASFEAIHAGLECAVFKDKYSKINIVSIGPNILNPHSKLEKVEIKSVYKVYEIVKEIASLY